METRLIGASDLRVSVVGLGCSQFGGQQDFESTSKIVGRALDLGVTHFDTADIYGNRGGSEEFLGRVVGARRKDIVLATKFGRPMSEAPPTNRGSRDYVISAVEASLKRLNTDWIDLLFMHQADASTPIEETFRAFEELKAAGKVRYFGASNFSAVGLTQAAAAVERLQVKGFVACQDEFSLLKRGIERELIPTIEKLGLALIPYYPLAGGALSGKYRKNGPVVEGRLKNAKGYDTRFLRRGNLEKVEKLARFAESRGRTLLDLAMSWLAQHKLVASIIAGATSVEQVEANVKAVGWRLTAEEMAEVNRLAASRSWWKWWA